MRMMCVLCCGVEPSTKNEIVRNFLPPPYKKKCVNIMKQTKNGSYEKINAIWRKKVKTNKNGNNCSTKDLVVKAADIFKAKLAKQKEHKLCFYKRIRGGGNN